MIGVVSNTNFDILERHGAAFAEHAPELTLLRPEEVTDPNAVEFLLTFAPDPEVFECYPNLKARGLCGGGDRRYPALSDPAGGAAGAACGGSRSGVANGRFRGVPCALAPSAHGSVSAAAGRTNVAQIP